MLIPHPFYHDEAMKYRDVCLDQLGQTVNDLLHGYGFPKIKLEILSKWFEKSGKEEIVSSETLF